MPYPHAIRLRSAWCRDKSLPGVFRRAFHCPSGLSAEEQVWVVVEGLSVAGEVALNGQSLGPLVAGRWGQAWPVSPLLAERNELVVSVAEPSEQMLRDDAPSGDVRLEIRHRCWIEGFALWAVRQEDATIVHLEGRICGAEGALILAVNTPMGELAFHPCPDGEAIRLALPVQGFPTWPLPAGGSLTTVNVKLLDSGQTTWHTQRATAAFVVDEEGNAQNQDKAQAVRHVDRVLSEAEYKHADLANELILQTLEPAWLEELGSRLAHHPAIVAWCPPAGSQSMADPRAKCFGRPWWRG